jgi:hypothetical protein
MGDKDIAWNEAEDALKQLVLKWSANHLGDAKDWIMELATHKVRSFENLKNLAESSRWEKVGSRLSDMLSVCIEKWSLSIKTSVDQELPNFEDIIESVCRSPKRKLYVDKKALEFLYTTPSDYYYNLFKSDYLVLPDVADSAKKSVYVLTAPSGSGKTKFMFDLALRKGHYVLYIDWSLSAHFVDYICRNYENNFELRGLRNDLIEVDRVKNMNNFELCKSEAVQILFDAMKWFILFADQISHYSPESFLKFWVERQPNIQERILKLISSGYTAPDIQGNKDYIFAFDESQILLNHLHKGQVYTFGSEISQIGSLYTIFSRVCDYLSVFSKVIISGTSIKLSLMSKHASLIRKNLYSSIRPPLFTEVIAEAFLINFGISTALARESKRFLVGRPIACMLFVQSWKEISIHESIPNHIENAAIRAMLVNITVERMVEMFKKKDDGNPSTFLSRIVSSDKRLTFRHILSDLCSYGYISTLSLQDESSIVEEISTLFLPLKRRENTDIWKYEQNDPIAFEALLRYMHDNDEFLCWDRMNAERMYSLILEQRAINGEVGEFIIESMLMRISRSNLALSENGIFSALKNTEYGQCILELKEVQRDPECFFDVLNSCNFDVLCVNVDRMARFDFFCLAKHPNDEFVVAVFGGCKLYSRNVPKNVFCDNILSTDPFRSYMNASGAILNQSNRERFKNAWHQFNMKYTVKVLQIVFTYPQPVGSIEYPESNIFQYDDNQLCIFIGKKEIEKVSFDDLNLGLLAKFATGCESESPKRQGIPKKLLNALKDLKESKKIRKRRKNTKT